MTRKSDLDIDPVAPEQSEADESARTFRSTISLPAGLAAQVKQLADQRRLSVVETVRVAVQQFVEYEGRSEPTASVTPLLESVRIYTNRYQTLVAQWRLARARMQLKGIESGELQLKTQSPETYLLLVLAELQTALGLGDEVRVLTNEPFWKRAHADAARSLTGPDEFREYLRSQSEAVGRGMTLERIIVVDEHRRKESKQLVELHEQFMKEVRAQYPDRAEHIQTRVLVQAADDPRAAPSKPFAVVQRQKTLDAPPHLASNDCFVIEPHYTAQRKISEIRLFFSDGQSDLSRRIARYQERFETARTSARPLGEYLADR